MAVNQVNFLNSKNRQFLLPAKDKDLLLLSRANVWCSPKLMLSQTFWDIKEDLNKKYSFENKSKFFTFLKFWMTERIYM